MAISTGMMGGYPYDQMGQRSLQDVMNEQYARAMAMNQAGQFNPQQAPKQEPKQEVSDNEVLLLIDEE